MHVAQLLLPAPHLLEVLVGLRAQDAYEEHLHDNTVTPVPDQVQFRLDWAAWLRTLTGRERRMTRMMARGERTMDVGRQFELSPSRVSQLRSEFRQDWHRFCGKHDSAATVAQ